MTNTKILRNGICHSCKAAVQLWFNSYTCLSTAAELHPVVFSEVVFHRSILDCSFLCVVLVYFIWGSVIGDTHEAGI